MTEHVQAVQPEPDMVQLLTPEGSASTIRTTRSRSPTTRSARSTATSSWCAASTPRRSRCSGRANSACGRHCSARRPRRSAPAARCARQDMAFPTYREHGVAWCRDVDPLTLLGLFRGTNLGGCDPDDHNFNLYTIVIGAQTLHATGYAMGVVRDGAVGTGDPDRDTAVLAFFGDGASSQGDVNEAFVWAGARQPAGRLLLPEQPVGDQRAGRAAEPGAALQAGGAASASPACASTATTCSPASPSPARPWTTRAPVRARRSIEAFTYRMNPHTTSDDPTRYRLGDELETWKLRDPIERVRAYLARAGRVRRTSSSTPSRPSPRRWPSTSASGCRALPDPTPESVFDHVYADMPPRAGRAARRVRRPSSTSLGGTAMADMITMAKALNDGLRTRDGGRPQGRDHGRGRRPARRRLPDHRRAAEGLRRGPGDRHPARRVRHHRHRGRAGHPRLPAGVRDPVRRLRLPRLRPDRQPGRQVPQPLGRLGEDADHHPHPVRRRHRRGRAPLANRPRPTSRTPPGLKVVACSNPSDALLDDPAGDRLRRPGDLLRAQAPVLEPRATSPTTPLPLHSGAGRARRAATSRSSPTARWSPPRWTPPRRPPRTGVELEVIDLRTLSPLDTADRARLGTAHRTAGRRARGARSASAWVPRSRPGSRSRRSTPWRRPILRVGRLRHPVPAEPDRGGVAARRRPDPRRRRPSSYWSSEDAMADSSNSSCPTSARV